VWCSDDAELWLQLLSARSVPASVWLKLMDRIPLETAAGMIGQRKGRNQLERMTGRRIPGVGREFIARHIEAIEKEKLGVLTITGKHYPGKLREIQSPPPVLFYRGLIPEDDDPRICLVGSRNASRRGRITAFRFSERFAERGLVVVSGMARGIDTAAHRGALKAEGETIAVLGCGIDVAYPPENASLAVEIAGSGCLLSEFPLGCPPLKHHFPSRNRILSGLSSGVMVVEAGIRSGAILTAGWAADQGREVYAVPGPVEFEGSRGPHELIKQGAQLVDHPDQIMEFIVPFGLKNKDRRKNCPPPDSDLPGPQRKAFQALELEPRHIDDIVEETGMSSGQALKVLLDLEIKGMCRSCGLGLFALSSRASGKGEEGIGHI